MNIEQDNNNLRPICFKDYVGQRTLRKQLSIAMEAAKQRGEALQHILLSGPTGTGKTTISNIIANEMGSRLQTAIGPALSKQADIMPYLMALEPRDMFFVDEVHRMGTMLEEWLYPILEDFRIDLVIDQNRKVNLPVPRSGGGFTFIAATTMKGKLSAPFRNRFGLELELELYDLQDLLTILEKSADKLCLLYDKEALVEIAKRSRGTPRLANRFLRQVRDYAQINNGGKISVDMTRESFNLYGIDELGVDKKDREYMKALVDVFTRPVGINAVAATIGEDSTTLTEAVEPYLLQLGFVVRTARGREITDKGKIHLNKGYI